MYNDMDDPTLEREAWEDDIEAFVPSFASGKVTPIEQPSFAATMVIDKCGDLAIRIMDENETMSMEFKMMQLLDFDPHSCIQAPWEQYLGLLMVSQRFDEFAQLLLAKVDEVRDEMDARGLPMDIQSARQHLRVINGGAKQDQ